MSNRFRPYLLFGLMILLRPSVATFGQEAPLDSVNMNRTQMTQWIFAGKVKTLEGTPIGNAKVRVEPVNVSAEIRYLQTDSKGDFYAEYYLGSDYTMGLKQLNVSLAVTKKGFHAARRSVYFATSNKTKVIPITLLAVKEDPALLTRADLVSILAPRLKKLGAASGLSAAAESDYASGVDEFLNRKRPERALRFLNKVILADPSCVQCHTMLGLAQLDDSDWDGAYDNFASAVHTILNEPGTGRSEPLIAAGEMAMWQHDSKRAAGFFVEALKSSPDDALALQELGRSQLLLENWKVASDYLAKAVAAGAGPDARLMLASALLGGDEPVAADKQMTEYLGARNVKSFPPRVRELWAKIQGRKEIIETYAKEKSSAGRPVDYLHGSHFELQGLEPASSQMPLDSILSAVGKNVTAYFRDLQNTGSLEEIHQEILRGKGKKEKVENSLDQKFRYLCLTPVESSGPRFREYRADLKGSESSPQGTKDGFMLTLGFASASIIFHPEYQSQSKFRYLGRQKVEGREYEIVAFAQQPAKARVHGSFRMGNTSVTTLFQGLAWIDRETHQIVRLHTDLLAPLPEIDLQRETTDIIFGEVHFKSVAEGFWMPKEVEVEVDWNGKHLRNEHQYSDFKLFSVQATQKIANPAGEGTTPAEPPDSKNFD